MDVIFLNNIEILAAFQMVERNVEVFYVVGVYRQLLSDSHQVFGFELTVRDV
jgi:hypothetical protein